MNINILTDEELAQKLFSKDNGFGWERMNPDLEIVKTYIERAKFIRQCIKDSTPKGLTIKEIEDIIDKQLRILIHVPEAQGFKWTKNIASAIHAAQERKGKGNNVA